VTTPTSTGPVGPACFAPERLHPATARAAASTTAAGRTTRRADPERGMEVNECGEVVIGDPSQWVRGKTGCGIPSQFGLTVNTERFSLDSL